MPWGLAPWLASDPDMLRRFIISVLIVLGIAAIVVSYVLLQPRPRIDRETVNRIEVGMSEAEVLEIIGAPPGNYGIGRGWRDNRAGSEAIQLELDVHFGNMWLGSDKGIEVFLDRDRKVIASYLIDVWREHDSVIDRFLQWIHVNDRKQRPFGFTH